MNIKDELKSIIQEHLDKTVSPIFIKRALDKIEESANDKDSLIIAAEGVSKLVSLFIDKNLAKKIYENLKMKIDKGD